MTLFKRALRMFLFIAGAIAGLVGTVAALLANRMSRPPRQRLWANPEDVGLPYEEVMFPATDGLRLAGWFIPGAAVARRGGATIVLIHGWAWNRLGNMLDDPLERLLGASAIDLLRLAHALHHAGFNVLMFDLRNHGESAASPPVSFGLKEANDVLGAINFVRQRDDVDPARIGLLGFSVGANAALFTLPRTDLARAVLAVQPFSLQTFSAGLTEYLLGPLSRPALWLTEQLYQSAGGMRFSAIEPIFVAAGAGDTPVLFLQGEGDRFGSVANVAQIAAASPAAEPLLVDTRDRFGGYRYLVDNPGVAITFFEKHLAG